MNLSKLNGPTQIVLNITNRCNMRCQYCFNSSESTPSDELSDQEFYRLVEEIAAEIKPYNVCFSGGEPLLRYRLLVTCAALLQRHGTRINIVSNGLPLNRSRIRELRDTGVYEIQVSLDGDSAETHERFRARGSFAKVVELLNIFREESFPSFGVSLVITQANWMTIDGVLDLLVARKTPVLALRPLLFFGRAATEGDTIAPTPVQLRHVARTIQRWQDRADCPRIIFPDPLSHIFAFGDGEPFFGMEIKANGDLIASPYLQLPLGNWRRHTVAAYWQAGWPQIWRRPEFRNLVDLVKRGAYAALEADVARLNTFDLIEHA